MRLAISIGALMSLALLIACASSTSTAPAPNANADTAAPARGPLEGVWQRNEVVVTGANPTTTTQPGLLIFAKTHYSFFGVPTSEARVLFKAATPTNEEKLVAYDSINANTGTYEVTGTTLTIRPILAKNPNFMAGGYQTYQFQIDGNTLTLNTKTGDNFARLGDTVVAGSGPINETRQTLTRVE